MHVQLCMGPPLGTLSAYCAYSFANWHNILVHNGIVGLVFEYLEVVLCK